MFDRQSLTTTDESWESALSLALACQLAYEPDVEVVADVATQSWGLERCVPIATGDTQGFVSWDAELVIISFRGTESVGDWLSNLTVMPISRTYGRVHRGFALAFDSVRTQIVAALNDADVADKQVWITGHSLGGALAALAAAEFAEIHAISGIHTFGQPKTVGSQAAELIRERYGQRFRRFVNNDDLVTRVPPGYQHVGQLIWFGSQGDLRSLAVGPEIHGSAAQPHELTAVEFAALQQELEHLKAATEVELSGLVVPGSSIASTAPISQANTDDVPEVVFENRVEGILPGVRDHALDGYLMQLSLARDAAVQR